MRTSGYFFIVVVVAASEIFEAKVSDPSSSLYKFLSLLLFNANIGLISQDLKISESSLFCLETPLVLPKNCHINEIISIV